MTRTQKALDAALGGAVLAGGALLAFVAMAEAAPPPHPNLQGTWVINTYLTSQLMKDQGGQKPSDSGSGGGFGHRSGGGRGGRNHQTSPDGTAAAPASENGNPLDALTITQTDTQVTITDKEGRNRVFKTDGSKVRDEDALGGPSQIKASWDSDGSLVVEVKPDKGSVRTETFEIANDHKHLYVTVAGGSRGKILKAYDPAPVDEPTPAPAKPPGRRR